MHLSHPKYLASYLLLAATAFAAFDTTWVPKGLPTPPPQKNAQGGYQGLGAYLTPEQGQSILDAALVRYNDHDSWAAYAEVVKKHIQEGAGLSPWPKATPLNAVVHSRRVYDGYSVENVYFESVPGNYVTGNLYRPTNIKPPYAAILSPHGHAGGRITKEEDYASQGRFREDMQLRCATLAKMGAVVFSIDMFGCDDSIQIVGGDAHRQPLSFTIQTLNSRRAIDFLLSIDGVDPKRVGVSGYSGGGTQTFIETALDPRVAVSVPVAMVSEFHFGGCPCESGQPIHSSSEHFVSNVMIAALAAPRPMLLVSDGGDWTKNTPTSAYPFMQKIYDYYGVRSNVANVHLPAEVHDYGPNKREAAYRFFADKLGLSLTAVTTPAGKIDESKVTVEKTILMHSFDAGHPVPGNALHNALAIQDSIRQQQQM